MRRLTVATLAGIMLSGIGAGPASAASVPLGCITPDNFSDTLCFDIVGSLPPPLTLDESTEPRAVFRSITAVGTMFGPVQILYLEPNAMPSNNISDAVVMGVGVPNLITGTTQLSIALVSDGATPLSASDVMRLVPPEVPSNWQSATPKSVAEFTGFEDISFDIFANSTTPELPFSVFVQLDAEPIPEPSSLSLGMIALVLGTAITARARQR
jgi:hypothetical protein